MEVSPMTAERFMKILADNGETIDSLGISPSKKSLAHRLVDKGEDSARFEAILNMAGIDWESPREMSAADVAWKAAQWYNIVMKHDDDDRADAADLFGTLAKAVVRQQPGPTSSWNERQVKAHLEFREALKELTDVQFDGLWQHGLNKEFVNAYNEFLYNERNTVLGSM
jgi:hypothetical protein